MVSAYDDPEVKRVCVAVAEYFCVPLRLFFTAMQGPSVARPRMIAMYLLRRNTPLSLTEIAGVFRRHHTTVLANVRRVEHRRASDLRLASDIRNLLNQLEAKA